MVKRWRRNSLRPDERLLDAARLGRPPVVREALGEHLSGLMASCPATFGLLRASYDDDQPSKYEKLSDQYLDDPDGKDLQQDVVCGHAMSQS